MQTQFLDFEKRINNDLKKHFDMIKELRKKFSD